MHVIFLLCIALAVSYISLKQSFFSAMMSIPNVENEPVEDVFFVEPPLERIGDAIELVNQYCSHYLFNVSGRYLILNFKILAPVK